MQLFYSVNNSVKSNEILLCLEFRQCIHDNNYNILLVIYLFLADALLQI